jgi:hypothetical protein
MMIATYPINELKNSRTNDETLYLEAHSIRVVEIKLLFKTN